MGGCMSSASHNVAGPPEGGAVAGSKGVQGALRTRRPSERRRSALVDQLIEAVKDHCAHPTVQLKTMNSILMKFATIEPAFLRMKQMFKEFDKSGDGALQRNEIEACLPKLGVEASDELLDDIFKLSDIDASHELDFHEFVIVVALTTLLNLRKTSGEAPEGQGEIDKAINIVADAFAFFDKDADGSITRDEVENALGEGSTHGGGSHHRLAIQRFQELDWDGDGTITFLEFLVSFVDWVVEDDEDE